MSVNILTITSPDFNVTTVWGECVPMIYHNDTGLITYECWDKNIYFGILTLLFIYFPSSFTLAAVLGPSEAGRCSLTFGPIMIVGGSISMYFSYGSVEKILGWTIGLFFVLLGLGSLTLAGHLVFQRWKNKSQVSGQSQGFRLKLLLFPLMYILSPLIFLYIKLLSIFKRDNKLMDHQKKMISTGEAVLEASPQYCLQMFILLHTLDPTPSQWFSIITSLITLNIPNIEKYFGTQIPFTFKWSEGFSNLAKTGIKDIILPILVLFLNTLGKIMSISIIAVFSKCMILFIILPFSFLLIHILLIMNSI